MVQPMRSCPVCDAIVLLEQRRCSICDHDLSRPAPMKTEEQNDATSSSSGDDPEATAPKPSGRSSRWRRKSTDDNLRLPRPDPPREGLSPWVIAVSVVLALALIVWFVNTRPIEEVDLDAAVDAADAEPEPGPLDVALDVCQGATRTVEGAAYGSQGRVHPAVFLIGDLRTGDVDTRIDEFPDSWQVPVTEEGIARAELFICISRLSTGEVQQRCRFGFTDEPMLRVDTEYRVRMVEATTGVVLADEPVLERPFGMCPPTNELAGETAFAEIDVASLLKVILPYMEG